MDNPPDKWALGRRSEKLVAKYIETAGYTILARNFHAPGGELDILCVKAETLFVVEVRSRRHGVARPLDTIGRAKQKHIFDATDAFMAKFNPDVSEVRFIVAEVEWQDDSPKIHLVFDPFTIDNC